jgi:hypothetical protein
MLTQLLTLKGRLAIDEFDVQHDALLTNAIKAISARFDQECNRVLSRTVGALHEFGAHETELRPGCYPVESVTLFELKTSEAEGWLGQTAVEYLLRRNCVISLAAPLGSSRQQARVTYAGGYVLPGTAPGSGQTPLRADLEQAAVEQVAAWFQRRQQLGVKRVWAYHGLYQEFAELDLLTDVRAVLKRYERWHG